MELTTNLAFLMKFLDEREFANYILVVMNSSISVEESNTCLNSVICVILNMLT